MLKALVALVGFLVLSLVGFFVWLRRQGKKAAVWTEPLCQARLAENAHDFVTAETLLRQALAAAQQQGGVFASMAPLALRPDLARVLYRKGDLDRAAALSFDLLQAARGAT